MIEQLHKNIVRRDHQRWRHRRDHSSVDPVVLIDKLQEGEYKYSFWESHKELPSRVDLPHPVTVKAFIASLLGEPILEKFELATSAVKATDVLNGLVFFNHFVRSPPPETQGELKAALERGMAFMPYISCAGTGLHIPIHSKDTDNSEWKMTCISVEVSNWHLDRTTHMETLLESGDVAEKPVKRRRERSPSADTNTMLQELSPDLARTEVSGPSMVNPQGIEIPSIHFQMFLRIKNEAVHDEHRVRRIRSPEIRNASMPSQQGVVSTFIQG